MKILILNLKGRYFDDIKSGLKLFEFRVKNDYWSKRLINKNYDFVSFRKGYPKNGDSDKIINRPYKGYELQNIVHEHFGSEPVEVFAIYT